MSHPTPLPSDVARVQRPGRTCANRWNRYFHSAAAAVIVAITLVGFQPFYLRGEGMAGRRIAPQLFPLVAAHGALMTAWVVMFLVQSLLVPARRRRLHMKLGWVGVGIALGVSVSGFMVAVRSVRAAATIPFWGMAYRQFLLVMLAEVAVFTLFVLAGVLSRRRPERHRAMMLLATLSILAGATVRMPFLFPVFGEAGWMGIFGPVFTLGAVFLLARSLPKRAFDRWLAAGFVTMIVLYVAASQFAVSGVWGYLAEAIFNT